MYNEQMTMFPSGSVQKVPHTANSVPSSRCFVLTVRPQCLWSVSPLLLCILYCNAAITERRIKSQTSQHLKAGCTG